MMPLTPRPLDFTALSILADRMLEADDHIEAYRAILPLLTKRERFILSGMIEVCPIHEHDMAICLDDRPEECRHLTTAP